MGVGVDGFFGVLFDLGDDLTDALLTLPGRGLAAYDRIFLNKFGDLAVRQEFPGGMFSELTNIRVGKQPDELFNIPAGYERMTAPQR